MQPLAQGVKCPAAACCVSLGKPILLPVTRLPRHFSTAETFLRLSEAPGTDAWTSATKLEFHSSSLYSRQ